MTEYILTIFGVMIFVRDSGKEVWGKETVDDKEWSFSYKEVIAKIVNIKLKASITH